MATKPVQGSYLQQAADAAPEAGFAPVNFGKLIVEPFVKSFGTGGDKHAPPTIEPMKDGQKLAPNQILVFKFTVNISELNPALQFEYERDVNIQKSGRNKTDWSEIVLPSLVKVFGDNWGEAVSKQPYVEVEDVPNVNGTVAKSSGKVLGVPGFLRAFKSKADCQKAREARFGSAAVASSASTNGGASIPDAVVAQVKSLVSSVGEETALTMLANKPFGDYEPDDLLKAAA